MAVTTAIAGRTPEAYLRVQIGEDRGDGGAEEMLAAKSGGRDDGRPPAAVRPRDGLLNEHGRAYEMWKQMMKAGEEYIKSKLQESHRRAAARPSIPHMQLPPSVVRSR